MKRKPLTTLAVFDQPPTAPLKKSITAVNAHTSKIRSTKNSPKLSPRQVRSLALLQRRLTASNSVQQHPTASNSIQQHPTASNSSRQLLRFLAWLFHCPFGHLFGDFCRIIPGIFSDMFRGFISDPFGIFRDDLKIRSGFVRKEMND